MCCYPFQLAEANGISLRPRNIQGENGREKCPMNFLPQKWQQFLEMSLSFGSWLSFRPSKTYAKAISIQSQRTPHTWHEFFHGRSAFPIPRIELSPMPCQRSNRKWGDTQEHASFRPTDNGNIYEKTSSKKIFKFFNEGIFFFTLTRILDTKSHSLIPPSSWVTVPNWWHFGTSPGAPHQWCGQSCHAHWHLGPAGWGEAIHIWGVQFGGKSFRYSKWRYSSM